MSEHPGRVALSDFEGVASDPLSEGVLFDTLEEFEQRDLPPAVSLVGSHDGTNLLPRFGWVMPWGPAGSGKTSILVDLLFHVCSGRDWLGYSVERALRVVLVINEGVPGELQLKLRRKRESWPHDDALVRGNLAIYVAPWGEFSFKDKALVEHARRFAVDFGADYVALDPLHTVASVSAGAPDETEAFKHELRAFGVWDDLGVITAHHSNKMGMISGDWARHADTVFHIEKDGKLPASKLTLDKARPADPDELGVPVQLKWIRETFGYERVVLPTEQGFDADAALAKALDVLKKSSGTPLGKEKLIKAVGGTLEYVREMIDKAIADGQIVDLTPASRYFKLVLPGSSGEVPTDADAPAQQTLESGVAEPFASVDEQPTDADERRERAEGRGASVDRRPLRSRGDGGTTDVSLQIDEELPDFGVRR